MAEQVDRAPEESPTFYTAAEVARLFRLDGSTLYRHLRGGTFPAIKIGGRYVVPRAVVERVIAEVLATGRCVDLGLWTESWRDIHSGPVDSATTGGS